jgi:hypothetical protein
MQQELYAHRGAASDEEKGREPSETLRVVLCVVMWSMRTTI